jgi:hypothetical protein
VQMQIHPFLVTLQLHVHMFPSACLPSCAPEWQSSALYLDWTSLSRLLVCVCSLPAVNNGQVHGTLVPSS